MMLRQLLLSFVLFTSTSAAENAQLNSSGAGVIYQPATNASLVQTVALSSSGFDPTYKLDLRSPIQDKNFYLLSLFERDPEVGKLLRRNVALKRLTRDKAFQHSGIRSLEFT